MSNFDDFLNNLNSANQNDVPEKKEESNLFDLNFEGSAEPQNVEPSEEPATPAFPEEVSEVPPVETGAPNEDLFNFAQEERTFPAEEAPAEEAPAEGLFNVRAPEE